MNNAATIKTLHQKHRRACELPDEPIPGLSDAELAQFEEASGHPLSDELRALFRTEGVFADAPDVYFEDVGYFALASPARMIESAQNLRDAVREYGWDIPPCAVLSLQNNEFIAWDLGRQQLIAIDGDDGEVRDVEMTLDQLFEQYAAGWAQQQEG